MPTYADTLKQKQGELIRKALRGSVFLAPQTAAAITTLTTGATAAIQTLPAGYKDAGWLSADGVTFGRDVTTSSVVSWGSVTPTRSDVTADVSTMAFSAQETNITTLGLATGAVLVPGGRDASSGEVSIAKPSTASGRTYRALSIAVDENDAGEIYIGRYFPRARVTGFAEQQFGEGDAPISWGVTLTGEEDSTLGYSERWIFAGPGWKSLLVKMGYTATT